MLHNSPAKVMYFSEVHNRCMRKNVGLGGKTLLFVGKGGGNKDIVVCRGILR